MQYMKRSSQSSLLLMILISAFFYLLGSAILQEKGFDETPAWIAILHLVSYFVGLTTSLIAIPVSFFGIIRKVRTPKQMLSPGLCCVASISFVLFLFVLPTVSGMRDRIEQEKMLIEQEKLIERQEKP